MHNNWRPVPPSSKMIPAHRTGWDSQPRSAPAARRLRRGCEAPGGPTLGSKPASFPHRWAADCHGVGFAAEVRRQPARRRGEDAKHRSLNPGFEAHAVRRRASLASGRGGIRTHVGVSPHDFQSCALSHSATRPNKFGHYHLQGTAERSTAGLTAKKHTDAKSEGTHPDERSEAEGLGIQNEMPDRQEYRPPKTRDRIRNRGPRQRPDGGARAKHRNLNLAFECRLPTAPVVTTRGGIRSRGPAPAGPKAR